MSKVVIYEKYGSGFYAEVYYEHNEVHISYKTGDNYDTEEIKNTLEFCTRVKSLVVAHLKTKSIEDIIFVHSREKDTTSVKIENCYPKEITSMVFDKRSVFYPEGKKLRRIPVSEEDYKIVQDIYRKYEDE